jgi:LmbE family N-acetylglucosaminyl deacetylase
MEHSSKKEIGKTILVVAAHPDDEVLGCGASIAKWTALGNIVHIIIMAEGATSRGNVRDRGAVSVELSVLERSAQQAGEILGVTSVKLFNLPDNRMDSVDQLDVVKIVEQEINQLKPNTVITHHSGDLNIDHRIVHEAVMIACRPQPEHSVRRILVFEVPSSTEWQLLGSRAYFQPNWFEDVGKTLEKKIQALGVYSSEMRDWPHARSLQNIRHLSGWRGGSIGCEAAEAFMLIRQLK